MQMVSPSRIEHQARRRFGSHDRDVPLERPDREPSKASYVLLGLGVVRDQLGNKGVSLRGRQPDMDAERLGGNVRARHDAAPGALPDHHQRRFRRRRVWAKLATQPIRRPGRQV